MNNEYDIKYTYLIGYTLGFEVNEIEGEIPKGYIVCPCYCINGNEVVIPFDFRSNGLVEPIFDEDGKCINSKKAECVFDDYFEAKKVVDGLNSILRARVEISAYNEYYNKRSYGTYSSKLSELLHKYKIGLEECYEVERNIMHTCKPVIVEKEPEVKLEHKKKKRK